MICNIANFLFKRLTKKNSLLRIKGENLPFLPAKKWYLFQSRINGFLHKNSVKTLLKI